MDCSPGEAGEYLKRVRKNKGFSQEDVKRQTGISDSRLSRIESGKDPSASALIKLAILYDIDLFDLYRRYGFVDEHFLEKKCRLRGVESLTDD